MKLAFLLSFAVVGAANAECQSWDNLSLTTQDRLEDAGWWPTKGVAPRDTYVGAETCKQCHAGIAAVQETTPMYHAAVRASQSEILKAHAQLSFQESGYRYSLERATTGVTLSVNNGEKAVTANVAWAFGAGEMGQTYLLEHAGVYTEGRLSYYTSLSALDITIGHAADAPLEEAKALGKVQDRDSAQHCFSCHTTAAVTSKVFEPERAVPGVTCEACHGPGSKHVAAMTLQHYEQARETILNPANLSPSDSVDLCGACHRTRSDVEFKMNPNLGVLSIRFQPYRLEKSRCWGRSGDARITCIACHDPHQPLAKASGAYDSKCLACHVSRGQAPVSALSVRGCKVADKNCTSCHMPRYEVPQSHSTFTDHDIRVVRGKGDREVVQ